jgi:hypothetical protein
LFQPSRSMSLLGSQQVDARHEAGHLQPT